ncbi:hypothetical protein [Streptomyces hundungensis]|uniref:hypothetical protein n=1 Tax=Streptomyces hundungensis TaxID=1077946 RepID=UPI0031F00DDC
MRNNSEKVRSGPEEPDAKSSGSPSTRDGPGVLRTEGVVEQRNARVRKAAQRAKNYAVGKRRGNIGS